MTKKLVAAATITALTLALSAPAALAQDYTSRGDNDNREDRIENRIDHLEDRYDSFDVDFEDGFDDEGVLISVDEGDFDGFFEDYESLVVVYDVDGDGIDDVEDAFLV